MKILIVVLFAMFIGCELPEERTQVPVPSVVIIDSCEYFKNRTTLSHSYNLTHKGNCKFCEARKQLETQKIISHIDSLKLKD